MISENSLISEAYLAFATILCNISPHDAVEAGLHHIDHKDGEPCELGCDECDLIIDSQSDHTRSYRRQHQQQRPNCAFVQQNLSKATESDNLTMEMTAVLDSTLSGNLATRCAKCDELLQPSARGNQCRGCERRESQPLIKVSHEEVERYRNSGVIQYVMDNLSMFPRVADLKNRSAQRSDVRNFQYWLDQLVEFNLQRRGGWLESVLDVEEGLEDLLEGRITITIPQGALLLENLEEVLSSLQCPICPERACNRLIQSCGHVVCQRCAETWLSVHNTCPLCRTKIIGISLFEM